MEPSSPYAPAYEPPATVVHRCRGIFLFFCSLFINFPANGVTGLELFIHMLIINVIYMFVRKRGPFPPLLLYGPLET